MQKKEWEDEQLSGLLKQLPKIEDMRSKQEIYQNIALKVNKRKRTTWILPSAAAAAAVFLIWILIPNLGVWQEQADDFKSGAQEEAESEYVSMQENADTGNHNETSLAKQEENEAEIEQATPKSFVNDENDNNAQIMAEETETLAVYEEDIQTHELLTYYIPDANVQNIVPVSVLVDKKEGQSKFDLFMESMAKLTEEKWGLKDYYPLDADIMYDGAANEVTVDVPAGHQYTIASAAEITFGGALESIAESLNVSKINLKTAGEEGIEYGNIGTVTEYLPQSHRKVNAAFHFYYPKGKDTKPFIVPYIDIDIKTIQDAFALMRKNIDTHQLQASIPSDIQFDAKVMDNKLVITFTNDTEIQNDNDSLYTIEAILMTAKDFKYDAVKIENADVEQVGGFNLQNELKVPVSANKVSLR